MYDCNNCELTGRLDGLWRENVEAWQTYHKLCGRTVRAFSLERLVIDQITEGWDLERKLDLLSRLDVIVSILEPASDGLS